MSRKVPCSAEAGCPRFVRPAEPDVPPAFNGWLNRIARLDSMQAAGCRFRIGDLDPQTWTALVTLQGEKHRMERKVWDAKDRVRKAESPQREDPKVASAMEAARKQTKSPRPGGSLFAQSKPLK